jgi:iron complex transport system substrate-binding protein
MKKIAIYILFFLIIVAFIACNKKGKESSINEKNELRIVSLAPSITKQLKILELDENIIGHTSYCPAENLTNSKTVATATEVNVEKVASIKPSVVLCSSLTKKRTFEMMQKLDINVEYLPVPKSYEDIEQQFMKLAKAVQKKQKAKQILERERRKLDSLQNLIPKGPKPEIFIEIGANPLFAATSESFMHDYIRFARGKNIAAGLESGTISRESVIVKNPDVIILVTMGKVGKEEKEVWKRYSNLNAVKKNNIFMIDPDKASLPTPVNFTEVLGRIIELIYLQNN